MGRKKILAIDYGTKMVGLASFCQKTEPFPTPFDSWPYQGDDQLVADLKRLIEDEQIEVAVLGLPLSKSGEETPMAKRVTKFGEKLSDAISPIPLHLQDEALSSYEAKWRMKESPRYNFKVDEKHLDAVAAVVILEEFLASRSS